MTTSVADGEWHRLYPATPFLRGGIVVIAILGYLIVQFRDVFIGIFIGTVAGREPHEDPMTRWLLEHSALALLIVFGLLVAIIGFGWLSWRMHTYRVTDELIEEREGVIWRRHRRGRLDRVQGVDIVRPLFPRIFGAARLEISMAGSDGSIRLSYVASARADELRAGILAAASLRRRTEAQEDGAESHPLPGPLHPPEDSGTRTSRLQGAIVARANEFLTPELREPVAASSLVTMHPGRLVGATALRFGTAMLLVLAGAVLATIYRPELLFVIIPILIGVYGFAAREVLRSLQYSIASTPDGIRIGYGLLSTTNETLPPGRVHAIELSQPLFWRPFGWWRVRINRASASVRDGGAAQANTTILPVGTIEETLRVVGLILPDWTEPADFTVSPRRARWVRWFSWRRNGFAFDDRTVVLRRGRFWRTLTLVPLARVQSVGIEDGPLTRAMRLARVDVHTVVGVVRARVGALDAQDAVGMWRDIETRALGAMT
ncbi:MAG TPA: PH domain-containing protein [Microbacteriaceae bacterium]|nr:PH domain-containing protein [Microbacteriaceae bacterium]